VDDAPPKKAAKQFPRKNTNLRICDKWLPGRIRAESVPRRRGIKHLGMRSCAMLIVAAGFLMLVEKHRNLIGFGRFFQLA
jgi:hypothetical protein